ncbi:sodium:proton antiporter [Modestobacter sp. I12A-02628]|uniref:Sodium:proton antiporter n=1 Tax=Goekera deserti TaxID=2497753 RepID=A0A7K3WI04_9ACTN|nr:cation:proton antiporter [Goekera deserti]MPQ96423.1 sodium:proton antiporter [Goekera deserti]NDI47264.1 sodium:proton antiporter [Goekera deserti]NEL56094.1 sodium:proton antiporter [Goekera deserti]
MDPTPLVFLGVGTAALLAAVLPRLLSKAPISLPMVFVAVGIAAFSLIEGLPDPDPMAHPTITTHLAEVVVIVSLMGAGLALDRPIGWRRWSSTWRLLGITMPLSILVMALLGHWVLGLGVAAAVLLAAALAPTDPVLATEVQVAEPSEDVDSEDEARFALTSEAGLNDGLAFPFTYAAIAMATVGAAPSRWLGEWLLLDVLWRIAAGVVIGVAAGWLLNRLFFSRPAERLHLAERSEGFVALGAIALAYGAAELAEGYGFIAVFVCACVIRSAERAHGRHAVLHQYVETLERLLTVAVLVLLGGAVARGILDGIGWVEIVVVAVLLLLVRPLTGLLGMSLRGKTGSRERGAIAFFGVRGIGSIYYIAYALGEADFGDEARLWSLVALVVVSSVLLHGVTATPVMNWVDRQRRRAAEQEHGDADKASVTAV